MRVRVLTFGVLREMTGGPEEMVELADGSTVGELIGILRGRTSNNSMDKETDDGLWRSVAVAVNREYSSLAAVLREGDEVALLPPVSGGCFAHGETRASLGTARTANSELRSRRLFCCADREALAMLGTARTADDSLRECCVDDLRE